MLLLRTSITYGYVVAGTGLGPHAGIGLLIGLAFGLLSVGLHCARTDGCPEIFGGLDDAVNDLGGTIEEAAEDAANVARKVGEVAAREGKRAFEQGRRIPAPLDPCRLPGLGLCGGSEDDPEVLYHYTSAEGANGIMACQCVFASSGSTNARHGDGAYFTDLAPTVTTGKTPGQLSYAFYEVPWNAPKVQYWVALDVGQMANRPQWVSSLYGSTFSGGIFLSPSTVPVSVAGAIVGSGPTPF